MQRPNVDLKMKIFAMGIKQQDLARRVRVSPANMSLIVQGKTIPTVKTAILIARELGMTVEELWGYLVDNHENPARTPSDLDKTTD